MWRRIKENKSTKGLGRIVCLACELERANDPKHPQAVHYRSGKVFARVATVIRGKCTRRSEFEFASPSGLWAWLNKISAAGNPINIFVERSAITAPVCGLFQQVDNGGLLLEWEGQQRKTAKPRDNKPTKVAGVVCLTSPPTIVIGRMVSGSILRFLDIANWGIGGKDLGDILYYDRVAQGKEAPHAKESRPLTPSETIEAIESAVVKMISVVFDRKLGMFRWTAASQAMAAWRHGRMGAAVITHDEKCVQDLERAAYFGGRIGVWFARPIERLPSLFPDPIYVPTWGPQHVPRGPIFGVDVNGLFPVVMRDCLYPRCLVDWRSVPDGKWTGRLDDPASSIAEVVLTTNAEQYPWRGKEDTIYPRGTYRTWLAGPELARAVERNRVQSVGSWARYELADLFSVYVDELWDYRLAACTMATSWERRYWKLLLNSLYGKFGQRLTGWVAAPNVESPGPWQVWHAVDHRGRHLSSHRSIGKFVQVLQDAGPARDSFCAVSAFITSNARIVMDRLREMVGEGHYYYQAIDSLYVDSTGYNKLVLANMISTDELGMLKREGRWDEGHFIRPGNYILDGDETASGRMLGATSDGMGGWLEEVTPSLDQQVGARPDGTVRCTRQHSLRSATVHAGTVNAVGWVSPPVCGLKGKGQAAK